MSEFQSCSSSSSSPPTRVHFSDVTNKKTIIDDDRRWKLPAELNLGAPTITIDNDENENENENDAWNEYRHLFESNRSQMLNPSIIDNYLLRHSSANTSLNDESNSLEPLIDNHDDIFSMIEQAGITFGR